VHLKLHWSRPCCFVLGPGTCGLSMNSAAISEKWFVVEIVSLAVRISSLQASCVIEQSLVVGQILISGLCLAQGDLFTNISFLPFDFFLLLSPHLLQSFFSFNLSHPMIPELLTLTQLVVLFILIVFLLLNLLVLLPCLHRCPSQFFLLLDVLLVVYTPLYFGSLLQLYFRLPLSYVQRIDDISKGFVNGVVLQ